MKTNIQVLILRDRRDGRLHASNNNNYLTRYMNICGYPDSMDAFQREIHDFIIEAFCLAHKKVTVVRKPQTKRLQTSDTIATYWKVIHAPNDN
jgi:hypothetical protein